MKLKTYYETIYRSYYKTLSPSTVSGYESSWHLYIKKKFGDWEIEQIRVRDINIWLTEFDSAGAARKAFKILRQIINAAIADEVYPDTVAEPKFRSVRQPKVPPREKPRSMTLREMNQLLRACYGWEHEATVICGVWLGLRRSEQCGLQWRDINLKTGVVMIRRGVQVINGELLVTDVKTHRSMRPNVLPKVAIERLREIKRQINPKPTDWLMGAEPNPETYARKLKSHTKKCGVYCPAPKFFRHNFSTNMHKLSIPDVDIQYALGHEEFSTTANNYMMLDTDIMRRNIRKLEREVLKACS